MPNSKTKRLFVDISEFSILAARTSGSRSPMIVEEVAELPLREGVASSEIRTFLKQLIDFRDGSYCISRCGVYPQNRFLRLYEADSVNKAKDPKHLANVLQEEFNVNPAEHSISILNAENGSDFDLERALTKKLIFCGAPTDEFQREQDRLLEYGLYPERLELSTVTTLGGVCDYARFNQIHSPILCVEITSTSANIFIQNEGQLKVALPVPFGLDSIYPLLQRELGLKDEASARKLFFSNTFDFAEMGPKLLRPMVKELQSTTGFYEVQTGLTIDCVFFSVLPKNLSWIAKTISDSLGLEIIQPDIEAWMKGLNVKLGDEVEAANLNARWVGLFNLMGEYNLREGVASETE